MKVNCLSPWFGSNRMLAEHVGEALAGCEFVAVPFAGGMSELKYIKARTIAVNDLHRHVINLANVVARSEWKDWLVAELENTPFHPDALLTCQEYCKSHEVSGYFPAPDDTEAARWAFHYFVCSWMARNGKAGTKDEFDAGISSRWEAGGGDSAIRFRNATESLHEWHKIMRRCTFTTLDVFEFLDKCKDVKGHGIYCDSPFPGPGDAYKHTMTRDQLRELATRLTRFTQARIVCRYYDTLFIRELYPESEWTWHYLKGRKQTNVDAPEVLLVRN